jgi:hypothetical protein
MDIRRTIVLLSGQTTFEDKRVTSENIFMPGKFNLLLPRTTILNLLTNAGFENIIKNLGKRVL